MRQGCPWYPAPPAAGVPWERGASAMRAGQGGPAPARGRCRREERGGGGVPPFGRWGAVGAPQLRAMPSSAQPSCALWWHRDL